MDAVLIYLLLFGGASACVAVAGFFVFARHRGRIVGIGALALFCLSLLVVGRAVFLATREARNAARWVVQEAVKAHAKSVAEEARAAESQRNVDAHIALLKSFVPPELRASEPADFYTYDGFRDWYRIPLRFPYQLQSVDSLEFASLGKFNGKGPVNDPNTSCTELPIWGITHAAFDGHFLLVRRVSKPFDADKGDVAWILFDFATERSESYSTRESLLKAAAAGGYGGEAELKTVDELFNESY